MQPAGTSRFLTENGIQNTRVLWPSEEAEGDALVAFKLDELTDTQGETVKLKLKWNSFSGEKSAEFDYCTRKATNPQAQEVTAIRCTKKVK